MLLRGCKYLQNIIFRRLLLPNSHKYYKYCTERIIDRKLLNRYIENLRKEYKLFVEKTDDKAQKKLREMAPLFELLDERDQLFEHLNCLNELAKENEEIKKLAEEEKSVYNSKILTVEQEITEALLAPEPQDSCDSIVLEINAGVGGQEAMLFAHELFNMYYNFSEYKGWSIELAQFDSSDIGGLRHSSLFINGSEVFKYLKYEAGVHRVQRIPATERSGRVHTSTVSVIALPQPRDVDLVLYDKDLKIETKRASGAGGQHVNTTDSAVRIIHLPTGIFVECQVDRSQIKNRQIALQRLKAKLYEIELKEQTAQTEATRKSQVRSNFRNEKIRTYNFSQDRLSDHRLQGFNLRNLKGFMLGGETLDMLINKLHGTMQQEKLLQLLNSMDNGNNSY